MTEDIEKGAVTTMDTPDGEKVVDAMKEILEALRRLPWWGNRKDGLIFSTPSGDKIEVTGQSGSSEAISIVITPKP